MQEKMEMVAGVFEKMLANNQITQDTLEPFARDYLERFRDLLDELQGMMFVEVEDKRKICIMLYVELLRSCSEFFGE
jgi:hypothetical protein